MTTTETQNPVITEEAVPVWNGKLTIRVKIAGTGSPVVYLHPASGLRWDPFLSRLALTHTVYAIEFPGTSNGDPYAIHLIDRLSDVVLIYEEVLRTLGLHRCTIIGQSFGGMLAAELVAAYPEIAARAVLLTPIGLWREDLPVARWLETAPEDIPALMFHDPSSPGALSLLALPEDPDIAAAAIAAQTWAIGVIGKFTWPIPDRGLRARLHRVTVPTLVLWGRQDRLNPMEYAEQWQTELADCRLVVIDECGHIPQAEKLAETLTAVNEFLEC
jgi:pimeloyl-ACP methyl ester carboxylesterase